MFHITLRVTIRREQWSGPLGAAELHLQIPSDRQLLSNLEPGNILQGTMLAALDELDEATKKEKEEAEDG